MIDFFPPDTSDDDVASILEQMSRLQPSGPEYGM